MVELRVVMWFFFLSLFFFLSYKGVIIHSIDVFKLLHLKTEGLHELASFTT